MEQYTELYFKVFFTSQCKKDPVFAVVSPEDGKMHFRLYAVKQGSCNQLPPIRGVKTRDAGGGGDKEKAKGSNTRTATACPKITVPEEDTGH
jgi:hypothetical protein